MATPKDAEVQRLEALDEYEILDTAEEKIFDDITLLASYICQTPIALISLVDRDRQWFKSKVGLDARETPREIAFCHHAIQQDGVMVVNNALNDKRFVLNPLVTEDPHIRFYAGAPITTQDGYPLGTLCVIDRESRELSESQRNALEALARQVMHLLESRRERIEKARRQAQILAKETEARKLAEEASRLKDDFLATVSHELRTPLNAILGWAKMMSSGKLDEAANVRALETIIRSAQSQSQLIEDLLDISRIISGKLRLDVHPVRLQHIIESAIESVKLAAENKSIRLITDIDPDAEAISGDSQRLQQVAWNLLSNAIKFTPKDGEIHINLKQVNSHLEFFVSDNGRGITPDFLPYVFERFRQADGSSTRRAAGIGLGLSIVRNLVEIHGGTISVESEGEEKGATFTVILPLKKVHETLTNGASNQAATETNESSSLEISPMLNGVKIIAVDDEEDARFLIKEIFTYTGAEVTVCSSAAEVLETFQTSPPHILISDIGMPGEDGYSLIAKIRELEQTRGGQIPAIALTAYTRNEDRDQVLSSGFQLFLTKPFEPAELIAAVRDLAVVPENIN